MRAAGGAALGGDLTNQHLPQHYPSPQGHPPASERPAAREERRCQGVLAQAAAHNPPNRAPTSSSLSSTTTPLSAQPHLTSESSASVSAAATQNVVPYVSSRLSEGASSSSESLAPGANLAGGVRRAGGEHHPPSHIPRAIGSGSSSSLHSLASRGSASSSAQASPPASTSLPASSSSSTSSTFTGRLGQPPRGPLSLHSYSRKNIFLQHSLHTSELLALTQRDS